VISLFVLVDSVVSASFSCGSIGSGQAIVQRGVDGIFPITIIDRFYIKLSFKNLAFFIILKKFLERGKLRPI